MIDQPIRVVVEYAHGTVPEWVKTLITAGAGAVIGFFSSSGLEFVKLWVGAQATKKFATREILDEVVANRKILVPAIKGYKASLPLTPVTDGLVLASLRGAVSQLSSDRYDFFYNEERASIYRIDQKRNLFSFHRNLRKLRTLEGKETTVEQHASEARDLHSGMLRADLDAMLFLREHRIDTSDPPWEISDEQYVWPAIDEMSQKA